MVRPAAGTAGRIGEDMRTRTGSGLRKVRGAGGMGLLALWPFLAACEAEQSALHPTAQNPREVAQLFWVMAVAGALIWAVVMGIAIWAVLSPRRPRSERFADHFILAGGAIFPTVVLAALLVHGLRLLSVWHSADRPDLLVEIVGEQFWWRIAYVLPDGTRVETANELHLPQGRVVELHLSAHDVIHSFWVPSLGGKLDMIPGRVNVLRLEPEVAGRFRGVCAEYCGLSHALMALPVIVHPPGGVDAWLLAEAAPATPAADAGDGDGLAQALATLGAPRRDIPACLSCHGPAVRADYPRLAGQDRTYLPGNWSCLPPRAPRAATPCRGHGKGRLRPAAADRGSAAGPPGPAPSGPAAMQSPPQGRPYTAGPGR